MSDSGRTNDCCGHTVGHDRNCRDAEIVALKAKLDATTKAVQMLRDLQPFLAAAPREIFGTDTTEYGEYSWPVVAEFESRIVQALAIIDGTEIK